MSLPRISFLLVIPFAKSCAFLATSRMRVVGVPHAIVVRYTMGSPLAMFLSRGVRGYAHVTLISESYLQSDPTLRPAAKATDLG